MTHYGEKKLEHEVKDGRWCRPSVCRICLSTNKKPTGTLDLCRQVIRSARRTQDIYPQPVHASDGEVIGWTTLHPEPGTSHRYQRSPSQADAKGAVHPRQPEVARCTPNMNARFTKPTRRQHRPKKSAKPFAPPTDSRILPPLPEATGGTGKRTPKQLPVLATLSNAIIDEIVASSKPRAVMISMARKGVCRGHVPSVVSESLTPLSQGCHCYYGSSGNRRWTFRPSAEGYLGKA